MVDLATVALVLGGAVLLFAGAALSVYGVAGLGALLGGSGGFLVAPTVGGLLGLQGLVATAAAVVIGALVGIVATYALLSMAVAALSFLVGSYVGFVAVAPILLDASGLLVYPAALGVGVVAAFVGMIMTKTAMVLISSFVGATLVSRSVTLADFGAAQTGFTLDPLVFDMASPVFLGLFVLGVLSQFGLFKFGYVLKLVAVLPGATVLRDRGEETD